MKDCFNYTYAHKLNFYVFDLLFISVVDEKKSQIKEGVEGGKIKNIKLSGIKWGIIEVKFPKGLFINNITNDLYVGSSITLSKRMTSHFYLANSDKATNIVLSRAMRKYELKNFSLGILEICAPDTVVCSELEQKWMDYYKPRYNVLKVAGSSSGFRHSIDTINKLKEQFKKESHPKYGTVSSPETINAIAQGIKEFYLTHSHPSKGLKGKLSAQYGIGGKSVFCYNQKGEELIFPSINGAKQHFHVRWTLIKKSIDTGQSVYLNGEPWIIQSLPRPAH